MGRATHESRPFPLIFPPLLDYSDARERSCLVYFDRALELHRRRAGGGSLPTRSDLPTMAILTCAQQNLPGSQISLARSRLGACRIFNGGCPTPIGCWRRRGSCRSAGGWHSARLATSPSRAARNAVRLREARRRERQLQPREVVRAACIGGCAHACGQRARARRAWRRAGSLGACYVRGRCHAPARRRAVPCGRASRGRVPPVAVVPHVLLRGAVAPPLAPSPEPPPAPQSAPPSNLLQTVMAMVRSTTRASTHHRMPVNMSIACP